MLLYREPSAEVVREFIASQRDLPFSYPQAGATQREPPPGYKVDHNRVKLGSGKETYARAVSALREWKQFELGWVTLVPKNQPLEAGTIVAVQAKILGLWWLNAARIVYLVNEETKLVTRYGFAYGTLPDHVERGEERFMVEWQKDDDSVWYDIYAFSKPRHPLTKIGFPLTRALQAQFVRDSQTAMKEEVRGQRAADRSPLLSDF